MSYDVYFQIDTGAGTIVTIDERNYTSNVSRMWDKALALPPKPEWNDDGSPRMCRRYDPDGRTWRDEQSQNWGLGLLHDAPASEAAGILAEAVERMEASPTDYRKFEPGNGWGDYEGALDFLRWIAETAKAHPAATIRISR